MNFLRSALSRVSISATKFPTPPSSSNLLLLQPQPPCQPQSASSRALSTTPALCRTWGAGWGYRRGPYLSLFSINHDGKRRSFRAAIERFKRLDWGVYIRPRGGRDHKHWKKDPEELWNFEQHIFCAPFHVRRLERMFGPEHKRIRHIPDDPYLKYNTRVSFHKHRWTKLKNAENIRLFGNNKYLFPRWKAHLSKHNTCYNKVEKLRYEPPGYVGNVAANQGVYRPQFVPEDIPAPSFERPPIRNNKQARDYRLHGVKVFETYYGQLDLWNPLLKDMFKKF